MYIEDKTKNLLNYITLVISLIFVIYLTLKVSDFSDRFNTDINFGYFLDNGYISAVRDIILVILVSYLFMFLTFGIRIWLFFKTYNLNAIIQSICSIILMVVTFKLVNIPFLIIMVIFGVIALFIILASAQNKGYK